MEVIPFDGYIDPVSTVHEVLTLALEPESLRESSLGINQAPVAPYR